MGYLPNPLENKKMILHILLLMLMIFVVSTLTSHLLISYHEKTEKQHQIMMMQAFLKDWNEKNDVLNQSSMRPVEANQLDMVQTQLIFQIQTYQLNLLSMKDAQQNKEQNGHVYTAEFEGSYENSIKCLQNFHAKDALIGIKHLKISTKNGKLHTEIAYKIYTK